MTRKHESPQKDAQEGVSVSRIHKPRWVPLEGPQSSIYANQVELHTSNWDVKIRFGEALLSTESENTVIEKARIVMSPQHTKAFLAVLTDTVRKYEAAFGEIPLNPQTVKGPEKPQ